MLLHPLKNLPSPSLRGQMAASLALVASAILFGCGGGGSDTEVSSVRTLSNRADLVTDGDALVEVVVPTSADIATLKVQLGSRDVSAKFARRSDGRVMGLVDGFPVGASTLTAALGSQSPGVALTVINHAKGGPVFSGPQIAPWVCMTDQNGLGAATDAQCNAPTKVSYFYRSSDPAKVGFLAYDPANPPTDVKKTTTDQGLTVPFVVRRERGTFNRYAYDIAVLADPATAPSPFDPPAAWNKKLYYIFAGGALGQHIQGLVPSVFQETALSRGFVTATSSGNVFGNNTNTVTSAETMMMVKERVIKSFGEIKYTISEGGSGGSIQQQVIANSYPGLLDGIQVTVSFPDLWTQNNEIQDCSLLLRYFDANTATWPNSAQQNAVLDNADGQTPGTCRSWVSTAYRLDVDGDDPTSASCYVLSAGPGSAPGVVGTGAQQPWMYNPLTNATGARCTWHDYQVAIFGKRPDGFANRPYDNVGFQYGLVALKAGKITPEQFVHMNENVGGRDIDWHPTSQRSQADAAALQAVYRSGQLNDASGLASIPVIDHRACENFEIHSCFHSWTMRERLKKAGNGAAPNHVILTHDFADSVANVAATNESFDLLDKWVAAVKADGAADTQAAKVARLRPATASDACWVSGVRTTDAAACAAVTPRFGDPRTGAGQQLALDIMKCQLAPLDRASYGVTFSDAQWVRLQAVFPNGACNWGVSSVSAAPTVPWLDFSAGPGGVPLGAAPTSR